MSVYCTLHALVGLIERGVATSPSLGVEFRVRRDVPVVSRERVDRVEREGLTVDDAGLHDVEVAQSGERVVGGQIRTGDEVVAGGEAADAGVRVVVSDAEAEHTRSGEGMEVGLIGLDTEVMEVLRPPTGGCGGRASTDEGEQQDTEAGESDTGDNGENGTEGSEDAESHFARSFSRCKLPAERREAKGRVRPIRNILS